MSRHDESKFERDEASPLVVSDRRPITTPTAALLSVIAFAIAATYAFAIGYSKLEEQDARHDIALGGINTELADHEARLRVIEKSQASISEDTHWLRSHQEEIDRRAQRGALNRDPVLTPPRRNP